MIDVSVSPAAVPPPAPIRHQAHPRLVAVGSEEAVPLLSADARTWISALRGPPLRRDQALSELHALLLRAARFELARRRGRLDHLQPRDYEDLATQAADDALIAILGKFDDFRGTSRFTTWAYKFALLEAGVKARRRGLARSRARHRRARLARACRLAGTRRTTGWWTASSCARCATPSIRP